MQAFTNFPQKSIFTLFLIWLFLFAAPQLQTGRAAPGENIFAATNTELKKADVTILLQPLGEIPGEYLSTVAADLKAHFYVDVTIMPYMPMPADAGIKTARGRYRAGDLLDYLADRCPNGEKIIGVTTADISIAKGFNKDWGIFGLGDLNGSAAIVSSCRIKGDAKLRADRLAIVARHELGHTLGLKHCPNSRCVMTAGDSHSIDPASFCPHCAKIIAPYLKSNQQ